MTPTTPAETPHSPTPWRAEPSVSSAVPRAVTIYAADWHPVAELQFNADADSALIVKAVAAYTTRPSVDDVARVIEANVHLNDRIPDDKRLDSVREAARAVAKLFGGGDC